MKHNKGVSFSTKQVDPMKHNKGVSFSTKQVVLYET